MHSSLAAGRQIPRSMMRRFSSSLLAYGLSMSSMWIGCVRRHVAHEDLAAHQLAAGDLALLQGDGQVDVLVRQGVAGRQVARRVDAADEAVQVLDLGPRARPARPRRAVRTSPWPSSTP